VVVVSLRNPYFDVMCSTAAIRNGGQCAASASLSVCRHWYPQSGKKAPAWTDGAFSAATTSGEKTFCGVWNCGSEFGSANIWPEW